MFAWIKLPTCEASRQPQQFPFNNLPMKRGRTEHAWHIPPAIDLCVLEMWCLQSVALSLSQSKNSECYRGSTGISPSPRESIHSLSNAIFFCFPSSHRFKKKKKSPPAEHYRISMPNTNTVQPYSRNAPTKIKIKKCKEIIRWVSKGIRVALSLYLIRLQSTHRGDEGGDRRKPSN